MPKVSRRTYNQYCSLARALDVVGDRWTLLLVRQLLLGPKRFTDLQDGLPGIGTNLLAQRLKELQKAGLIDRRTLPPPAASQVYELTPDGRALRSVLREFSRWGLQRIGPKRGKEVFRSEWAVLALEAVIRPEETVGIHDTYQLTVDGHVFHVRIDDGRVESLQGPAEHADAYIEMDGKTFMALGAGLLTRAQAIAAGSLVAHGDPQALRRAGEILMP